MVSTRTIVKSKVYSYVFRPYPSDPPTTFPSLSEFVATINSDASDLRTQGVPACSQHTQFFVFVLLLLGHMSRGPQLERWREGVQGTLTEMDGYARCWGTINERACRRRMDFKTLGCRRPNMCCVDIRSDSLLFGTSLMNVTTTPDATRC